MTLLASIAFTSQIHAVKAWPGTLRGLTAEGSTIEYTLLGDEFHHAMVSSDGFLLTEAEDKLQKTGFFDEDAFMIQAENIRLKAAEPQKRLINSNFPTIGTIRGLILLVEFADNEFHEEYDADFYRRKMNDPDFSDYGATGSARDYFIDQSSGIFTPEFDVAGPIRLSRNMSYYGANDRNGQDANPEKMVTEACMIAAEEFGVDFTDYDFDNDGFVDFVYVIYAGYAESYGASSNTIWPHASQLTLLGEQCEIGGKTIDRYACSSELKFISGDTVEGIGTFCHEFSHVLGLPDAYDTRTPGNVQLGCWDVMDQGNYNNGSNTPPSMSAVERATLGWLQLTELDTPADRVELYELNASNSAYRISTPVEGEYFTLENRQQKGWDSFQPGKGLMIMHIAYDRSAWEGNYINSGIIRRYDLVEADGSQGTAQETDLFPYGDRDAFTDYTTPSSLTWDGTPTRKGVTAITQEDDCISFRFMKDRFASPADIRVSAVGSDWFEATWSPVEEALTYRMDIREVLEESENPILIDEDMSALTDGKYPNANGVDISGSLDDFLANTGWSGSLLFAAGGYIQIGRYGESGTLQSPVIGIPEDRSATLALQVVGYPGKSVNFTIDVIDAITYDIVASFSEKANKTQKDVILPLEALPSSVILRISTSKERLFIDALRMVKGSVDNADIWNAGARNWAIEEIADPVCKVDGLKPGGAYAFTVTTSAAGGWHASEASAECAVTLTIPDGVNAVAGSEAVSEESFDLTGRRVSDGFKGLRIVITRNPDGSVITRKRID